MWLKVEVHLNKVQLDRSSTLIRIIDFKAGSERVLRGHFRKSFLRTLIRGRSLGESSGATGAPARASLDSETGADAPEQQTKQRPGSELV